MRLLLLALLPLLWSAACWADGTGQLPKQQGQPQQAKQQPRKQALEKQKAFKQLQPEQNASCARGNPNLDTGQCDCPWGYGGPDCSKLLFPACRIASNSTSWTCSQEFVQSCACLRQCWRYYCGESWEDEGKCESPMFGHMARCYEYDGVPEEEQLSDPPSQNDTSARYYAGIFPDIEHRVTGKWEDVMKLDWGPVEVVPSHRCPDSCHHRGVCLEDITNRESHNCRCHFGFQGEHCEEEKPGLCFNDCSGNGKCQQGFCQCKPGWWGLDCSRSKSYLQTRPSSKTLPPVSQLRVFVYDIPTSVAHDLSYHDEIYLAYKQFIGQLLKDWTVRTENPYEANMFFVPVFLYHYSGNLGIAANHLKRVVQYVQQEFPYWNRTQGADHFLFSTQDRALCHYHLEELLQDSIRLVHFGYYQFNNTLRGMEGKMEACIKPARDLIVPPNVRDALTIVQKTYFSSSKDRPALAKKPARDKLLFLAGQVRFGEDEYSGGVRQALFRLFNATASSDPDIRYYEGYIGDYEEQLRRHKFCVAPWGHGWGYRLPQALLHGCVPVIIQDHVHQYFEDVLPYEEFSVRLSFEDIPHIGQLLRAIDDADFKQLQEGGRRWYRAFYWDEAAEPLGGQAYKWTLFSLMKRLRYRKGKLIQPTKHCNLPPEIEPPPEQQGCPNCDECPKCTGSKGEGPACPPAKECPPVQQPLVEQCKIIVSVASGDQPNHTENATTSHRGWNSTAVLAFAQHKKAQVTSFLLQNSVHAMYLSLVLMAFIGGMATYSVRSAKATGSGDRAPAGSPTLPVQQVVPASSRRRASPTRQPRR